jgi:hypothetical protein
MTDLAVSLTEDQVMSAVGDFISQFVSCEVIQVQYNRVPMPKSPEFVAFSQRSMKLLSKPVDSYDDTTKSITSPIQFIVQLDFYGENSGARASSISSLMSDSSGADFFKASGYDMQTLYAGDAKQMPIITGEEQYLARWTFDAVFQINQFFTLPVQTANTLTVNLINVDATFPA